LERRTRWFWRKWLRARRAPKSTPDQTDCDDGLQAYEEGRYGDAEKLLIAAIETAQAQEKEGVELATALGNLAGLYRVQARYDEAEPLYKRAITICEERLEPRHPALAHNLNGLALIYRAQGMYEWAEPLCRRALTIAEKAFGPEHRTLASYLGNLLAVCLAQGRYAEAEPLYQRSVEIKEKVLGPKHPELAGSLENYAAFVRKTKGEREAAALETRAEAIRAASGQPARQDSRAEP
jgi:tetratricopeptide (TPR) repeat protein